MTTKPSQDGPRPPRDWSTTVTIASGTDSFAFRPHEILTVDPGRAAARARELFGTDVRVDDRTVGRFSRVLDVPDPVLLARELRVEGVVAQPNHVYFAACCCGPHPAARCGAGSHASPVYASPVYASPVYASPVYASPVYASPVYASPVYASPVYASPGSYPATGRRRSSVLPVDEATAARAAARMAGAGGTGPRTGPRVVILDTGFAHEQFRPAALAGPVRFDTGDLEVPDDDGDARLDPAAGHGTFIAGIVEQLAPGCDIEVRRVLEPLGDGDEWAIAQRITALDPPPDAGGLLNLSFSGYVMEHPELLAFAVRDAQRRGYTVVAAAGNDGVCRKTFPAALPGVVAVGAIGPHGPAPFTNFGPWVRACAPGVDVVSTFFQGFDGAETAAAGALDPDAFAGWGCWSGTSFAAPAVVGALAREMVLRGCSAEDAVALVVDGPALLRIPDLGTVVNAA